MLLQATEAKEIWKVSCDLSLNDTSQDGAHSAYVVSVGHQERGRVQHTNHCNEQPASQTHMFLYDSFGYMWPLCLYAQLFSVNHFDRILLSD